MLPHYSQVMTKDSAAYTKFATENGAVCGFLLMQKLKDGNAVALHLVADDRHIAKLLLKKAQDEYAPAQKGVVLMVPCSPDVEPAKSNFADDLHVQGEQLSCLLFSRYAVYYLYCKIFSFGDFL